MPGTLARLPIVLLTLALIAAVSSALAQTRPSDAIGYSAAQRRAVDAQLIRSEGARDKLASQLGLSRRLVRSIAQEVGFANPTFGDAQILDAVEAMAARAKGLQADNERLRNEITRLGDPAVRDPALALLASAEAALEEGRLADVAALYGEMRALRWGESLAAEEAWATAVDAEARTAELRQDFSLSESLRLEASRLQSTQSVKSTARAFSFALDAALARFREWRTFEDVTTLVRASEIIETLALPIATASTDPGLIWEARYQQIKILRVLGKSNVGEVSITYYDRAIEAFEHSIKNLDEDEYSDFWALSLQEGANVLVAASEEASYENKVPALEKAIEIFEKLLLYYPRIAAPGKWASLQIDRGAALAILSELKGGLHEAEYLAMALTAYRDSLEFYTGSENRDTWALIQLRIAAAEGRLGDMTRNPEQLAHWLQAELAGNKALEFYSADAWPSQHLIARNLLAKIQAAIIACHSDFSSRGIRGRPEESAADEACTVFGRPDYQSAEGGRSGRKDR